jgi:hypothetical protein
MGNAKTRYLPASSAVVVRETPVSVFLIVTVAEGTAAPEGSVITPLILAVA